MRSKDRNNQTDTGANEKWTPGAKGKTTDGPLDHTYPQGAVQQQGESSQQSGSGAGERSDSRSGSMQTQMSGGTGATQGITDSHQRAMEERSDAYGKIGNAQAPTQGGTGSMQRAATGGPDDPGAVHESNDVAGGLPRSPGGRGPWPFKPGTHLTGAQNAADMEKVEGVHESNDLRGGLPKSPGGANKLAADEKMDDDTGFSNRG